MSCKVLGWPLSFGKSSHHYTAISSTATTSNNQWIQGTDRFALSHSGRKRLCQVFCVTYSLACLCILMPSLPVLLFGRVLGGISTSILYSAFESWLISSNNNLSLQQSDLSAILGRATLLNGFVATGAGVFSNKLVGWSGSFASPFVASGLLLVLAYVAIQGSWKENYGSPDASPESGMSIFQLKRLAQAWDIVRHGKLQSPISASFVSSKLGFQTRISSSSASRRRASKARCTSSSSSGCPRSKSPRPRPTRSRSGTSSAASWSP